MKTDIPLEVVKLSFEQKLTNKEIAKKLHAEGKVKTASSVRKVQELLESGVQFLLEQEKRNSATRLDAHNTEENRLARELCSRFGLLDARVIPGGEGEGSARSVAENYADLIKRYGIEAASYFESVCVDAREEGKDLHVCVSGGQTILDMMGALPERKRSKVWFYAAAMIGRGLLNSSTHVGPETTATIAWSRSGRYPGHLFYGTVNPYNDIDRTEIEQAPHDATSHAWMMESMVKDVERKAKSAEIRAVMEQKYRNINMAIVGLGLIELPAEDVKQGQAHIERITMTNLLKPLGISLKQLSSSGAVGEVSYCMFDKNGNGRPQWNLFITAGAGTDRTGTEFYRSLVRRGERVMLIAGERKLRALIPAMEAKLFNVLITDAHTARKLLS